MSAPAKLLLSVVLVFGFGPLVTVLRGEVDFNSHWSNASRSSAGMAPLPQDHPEALMLVYAARAYNWRGLFAVHTWIATKKAGDPHYRVHQVIGWRAWRGQPVLTSESDTPDRVWFGNPPTLLARLSGSDASRAIETLDSINASYPYRDSYRLWPGPNSNTYVAHVGRSLPQLGLLLPPTAIGKDYLIDGWISRTPSGSGYQVSIGGVIGVALGRDEGLELNLFGAVVGVDLLRPAIKLPGIGRVGMRRAPSASDTTRRTPG